MVQRERSCGWCALRWQPLLTLIAMAWWWTTVDGETRRWRGDGVRCCAANGEVTRRTALPPTAATAARHMHHRHTCVSMQVHAEAAVCSAAAVKRAHVRRRQQPPLVLRWCVHEQGAALVAFTYHYPSATCRRRFRGRGVLLASRSSQQVVCGAERQLSGDRGHPLEAWRWCAVSAETAMWCGGRRNDGGRCVGVWRQQRRQAAAYTTHTSIQHTSAAVIRQGVAGVGV